MLVAQQYTLVAICTFLMLATTAVQARPHSDFASFYSSGRVTASGEKFDKAALRAAHPSLPFGSIVKVVNKRNGKSVVVEINDRGPAKRTRRAIDLTREAAKRIGMINSGVVPVRLEVAQLTRSQLNRAFLKLSRLTELRAAIEPVAARAETTGRAAAEPAPFQIASAIPGEITRPVAALGNIFKIYIESMIRPAGPHVRLTCPDGNPLPEPLLAVLRRAGWDFDSEVEVVSGFRPLSYNRAIYNNRCRRGRCRGDGSQHIRCMAADFRIAGVSAARLHAWALHQPELGGVGRYYDDFIHVDIRPRAHGRIVAWDWRGKRKFARKHHRHRRYARA
jgi:rare lipoprotein A